MNLIDPTFYRQPERPQSRRAWLRAAGMGFGSLGLTALLADEARLFAQDKPPSGNPLALRAPHFTPKAKRVIFCLCTAARRALIRSIPSRASSAITASRCRSSVRSHLQAATPGHR